MKSKIIDKDILGVLNNFEEYIWLRIQELIVPFLLLWFKILLYFATVKVKNIEWTEFLESSKDSVSIFYVPWIPLYIFRNTS